MAKRKLFLAVSLIVLISLLLVVSVPPAKAQFVISQVPEEDEYGQGMTAIYVHTNETGSWVAVKDPAFFLSTDSTTIEINESFVKISPTYLLNHTLHGLGASAEGLNIIRSNITVTLVNEIIFSEQNITIIYGGIQTATTWWYYAEIIIPVPFLVGNVYVVRITYEVFY